MFSTFVTNLLNRIIVGSGGIGLIIQAFTGLPATNPAIQIQDANKQPMIIMTVGGNATLSGSGLFRGGLTVKGTMTGNHLYAGSFSGAGLADCDQTTQKLVWDETTRRFGCSTDQDTLTQAGQGLTFNGTALRLSASFSGSALEIMGVMSGRTVRAQDLLATSGSLAVEGTGVLLSVIASNVNGVVVVDGKTYPKTGAGVEAAVNAVPDGGTVFVPPGTYLFASGDSFSFGGKSVHLMGAGKGKTVFKASGVSGGIIYDFFGASADPSYRDGIEIDGITFDLNWQDTVSAIQMGSARNVEIRNSEFRSGSGIWVVKIGSIGGTLGAETEGEIEASASHNVTIANNSFSGATLKTYEGILLVNAQDSSIAENNFTRFTEGAAILSPFAYNRHVTVRDNYVYNSTISFSYVQQSDNVAFRDNHLYFAQEAASLGQFSFRSANSQIIEITNNEISGYTDGSLGSGGIQSCDFGGSTFDGHANRYSNSRHLRISNNKLSGYYYGIWLPNSSCTNQAPSDLEIIGNEFTGGEWTPITIGDATPTGQMSNIRILDNKLFGADDYFSQGGITVVGSDATPSLVYNVTIARNHVGPSGRTPRSGIKVTGANNVRIFDNYTKGTAAGAGREIETSNVTNLIVSRMNATGALLSVSGTVSGSVLHAQDALTSSGGLRINGVLTGATALWGAGLADCDTAATSKLLWDVTQGRFTCGADQNTGTTYTAAQGITLNGSAFSLSSSFSGSALEIMGTASGRILHAQDTLESSGALAVEGNATFYNSTAATGVSTGWFRAGAGQGSTSILQITRADGSTAASDAASFSLNGTVVRASFPQLITTNIYMDSSTLRFGLDRAITFGNNSTPTANTGDVGFIRPVAGVVMVTDGGTDTGGTGSLMVGSSSATRDALSIRAFSGGQAGFLTNWRNRAGTSLGAFTATGSLGIGTSLPSTKLEVIGTASGRILHAQDELRSSGSLVVEGAVILAGVPSCASLQTDSNGALSCVSVYSATQSDTRYVNVSGDTMTGGLLIQNLTPGGTPGTIDGGLLLEVAGTLSGRTLRIQDQFTASGASVLESNTQANTLQITQNVATGTDPLVDGGVHIENTLNTDYGLTVYSNMNGSSNTPLALFFSDNSAFDQSTVQIRNDTSNGIALQIGVGGVSPFVQWGDSFKVRGSNGDVDVTPGFSAKKWKFNNTSGTQKAVLMFDNGYLGLGGITVNPKAALTVIGSGAFTSSVSGSYLYAQSGLTSSGILTVRSKVTLAGLSIAGATADAVCVTATGAILKNSGTATCTVSSLRFKHDIEDMADEALKVISSLRAVSFRDNATNTANVGFIAEEVENVDPRLVFYEPDGKTVRGVKYENFTAILAKAIQEFLARLLGLEEQMNVLQDRVTDLESRLEALEATTLRPLPSPAFLP